MPRTWHNCCQIAVYCPEERAVFTGDTIFEIARKQLSTPPPRPTEIEAEVPAWLEQVIETYSAN